MAPHPDLGARRRVLDLLPLMAVLALLAGQWGWLWAAFAGLDDRLDRLEQALARVERIEAALARVESKLEPRP